MNVALREENKAKNYILPFYWNKDDDNSLFKQSKEQGHIELAKDWILASGYDASKAEMDADPKVSGKIKLEGIAQDDTLLNQIIVKLNNNLGTNGFTANNELVIASYDSGNELIPATWSGTQLESDGSIGSIGFATEIKNATYGDLKKVGIITEYPVVGGVTKKESDEVPYTSQEYGHVVHWILYLDTEQIDGVAVNDVTVTATANDRGSPKWSDSDNAAVFTPNAAAVTGTGYSGAVTKSGTSVTEGALTSSYKMDVVPYITGIKTDLSDGNKKRPTILSRSALGVYPVRRGSNFTVEGFNLNGTGSTVTIGTHDYTPGSGTTQNSLIITTDANSTSSVVSAKVGTVTSLNNKTLKTVLYNQEPNGQNNDNLTDKRELHIVDVYTTTDKEDKRMLDMAIRGNSINFSAGYKDAYFSVMMGANETSVGTISNLRNSYTRYFDNAIAVNESGTPFTVSACGDTYGTPVQEWGNGPSQFALTKGTSSPAWEYGRISNNTSLLVLDSNWNGADLNNLDRFKWPAITVTGTNAATKGYISYYDSTQKLIKFRYFTSTTNTVASNLASYRNGSTATQYVEGAVNTDSTYSQGYTAIASANENSPYSSVGATSGGAAVVAWYDASNGALKMKYNTNPAESFSGFQTFRTVPTAGKVTFNIAVDGGTAKEASVTFANPTYGDAKHEFAYQLNLVLSNGYGAYAEVNPKSNLVTVYSMQTGTSSSISITELSSGVVNNAVAGAGEAWNKVTIDENSAGQYVAMKTDSKGGIHFAYYDTGNGDLKYAYMSSVTATPVVVTVDGYQQVGQYVDLAIREGESIEGTSCIVPYISYYSMSNGDTNRAAKVAKLAKSLIPVTGNATITSANASGVADDGELFSGNWEVFHVPTNGKPDQYRVNIGVTSSGDVYISYLADRIIEYVKVY